VAFADSLQQAGSGLVQRHQRTFPLAHQGTLPT